MREREESETKRLSPEELRLIDSWWRAANYLSVGQIYLLDNPLLREPLELKHVKPRLLGHWGTTPGLNFIYVHLNRIIKARDLRHDLHCRTGPRRAGSGREHLARGHLQRSLSAGLAERGRHAASVQAVQLPWRHSQPRRAGDARLDPRGRRARLLRFPTPTARRSTILALSSPASSETARPRPDRWRRPGIRTSFSILPPMAPCCRFCI